MTVKNCAALAAFIVFLSGCGPSLTAEMIDKLERPAHVYFSGHDLLSGEYLILPKPGDPHEPAPMSLQKDDIGWKLSQPDTPPLHLYEMTPEAMRGVVAHFNPKTMQCVAVASAKICAAPKGTVIRTDKVSVKVTTGYVVILGENWDHAKRK